MSININTQYSPVKPELVKSVLKVAANSNVNTVSEQSNETIDDVAKAEKNEISNINQVNKADEEQQQPSKESLDEAVQQLNTYVQSVNRNLEFNLDTDSGKTVVKVIDADTEELIRQIPNEEALVIAKQIAVQEDGAPENQGLLLPKLHA